MITRKHSRRMRTACFPTVCVAVASTGGLGIPGTMYGWGEWIYIPTPLWYTFHPSILAPIPLAHRLLVYPPPGLPMPPAPFQGTEDKAYPTAPWKGHGTKHAHPLNRITDTCENITFPQLRWWAVINALCQSSSVCR